METLCLQGVRGPITLSQPPTSLFNLRSRCAICGASWESSFPSEAHLALPAPLGPPRPLALQPSTPAAPPGPHPPTPWPGLLPGSGSLISVPISQTVSDLPLTAGWEGALAPTPHTLALRCDPGWWRKLHPYRNGAWWALGTGLPAGPGGLSPHFWPWVAGPRVPACVCGGLWGQGCLQARVGCRHTPGSGHLARTCTSGPGVRSAPALLGLPAHPGLMFPTQFSRAGGQEWSVVSSQLLLGQHHGLHVGARALGPGRGSGGPLTLPDALRPWRSVLGALRDRLDPPLLDPEPSEAPGPWALMSRMGVSQKTPGFGGGGPLAVDQTSYSGAQWPAEAVVTRRPPWEHGGPAEAVVTRPPSLEHSGPPGSNGDQVSPSGARGPPLAAGVTRRPPQEHVAPWQQG